MKPSPYLVRALVLVTILTACASYYHTLWPSREAFDRHIDPSCMVPFCDFTLFYYEQAKQVVESDTPIRKFFYSPSSALMLRPIGKLDLEDAQTAWVWFQALSLCILLLASCLLLRSRAFPEWSHVLLILLTVTSYPVLHNWKWGQTNTFVIALVLLSFALLERGYARATVAILATAIAFRYYPAVYACVLLVRRDYKAAFSVGLVSIVLLGVWPVLVLGAEHTWTFYEASFAQLHEANRAWIAGSRWTHYLPTVVQRLPRSWVPKGALGPRDLWVWIAAAIALFNIALCIWTVPKRTPQPTAWTFCLVALSTPFLVPTCWTHYFVYLPFVQTFLASELFRLRGRWMMTATGAVLALLPSIILSSVFYFERAASPQAYTLERYLLISSLLLLVLAYVVLAGGAMRNDRAKC